MMGVTTSNDAIGRSAMNKALWRIIPLIGLVVLKFLPDQR